MLARLINEKGVEVGTMDLASKTFSSGKVGFYGNAKITIGDSRYQCQCQMVKIASATKPTTTTKPTVKASNVPTSTSIEGRLALQEHNTSMILEMLQQIKDGVTK